MKFIDPTGHMKDYFGAALTMPKSIDDTASFISQAQTNWWYGQENINKIKAGKSTGLTCSGCNDIDTWKKYQDSMHAWAERIRDVHKIGLTAYVKAEAGASLYGGAKVGISFQNNTMKIYAIPTYGQVGANATITGGMTATDDLTGNGMSHWTTNGGGTLGAGLVGEGTFKTDGKYLELNVGGGVGAAAKVYLISMPVSVENDTFTATFNLPFNLGGTAMMYPTYVGAPSAQEWNNMLSGDGW